MDEDEDRTLENTIGEMTNKHKLQVRYNSSRGLQYLSQNSQNGCISPLRVDTSFVREV
jgi:hypothetical protein